MELNQNTIEEIENFLMEYERASNTKDFSKVIDFIHPKALFRFNDGDFEGIDAIQKVFEKTWSYEVENDQYQLVNKRVICTDTSSAVVTYNYEWSGMVKGKDFCYKGRGTNVMVKEDGQFKILYEHLSSM